MVRGYDLHEPGGYLGSVGMKLSYAFIAITVLAGCAPRVNVIDTKTIPPQDVQAMRGVGIFLVGQQHSPKFEFIDEITAFSCKHMVWDPPASKGDALKQLRKKAYDAGANAIIDVTFDTRGTDTWGTNCWETVQTSGSAVIFKD